MQDFFFVISAQSFVFWACRCDKYFFNMEISSINTPSRSSDHT